MNPNERNFGLYGILRSGFSYSFFQRAVAKRSLLDEVIGSILSKLEIGPRVLDVGCGTGQLVNLLYGYDREFEYSGVDPSANYIRSAKISYPDEKFWCGTLDSVDFPEFSFDLIVYSGVLHHISDQEVEENLRIVARLLKPGGVMVSIDPVTMSGQHLLARLLARLDRGKYVRSIASLQDLLSGANHLFEIRVSTVSGYLRVPYNHVIVLAQKAPSLGVVLESVLSSLPTEKG